MIPETMMLLTTEEHRQLVSMLSINNMTQLDKLIKRSKGSFKGMRFPGGVRINGDHANTCTMYGMADEITGGHVDKAINTGVSKAKNELAWIAKEVGTEAQGTF